MQARTAQGAPRKAAVPHSEMAERALVGAILLCEDEAWAENVHALVSPSDFFTHEHRALFTAEVALKERGIPVTLPSVCDEFRARGWVEHIDQLTGGMETYIVGLWDAPWNVSGKGMAAWAEMIRRYAQQREQISAGVRLIREGMGSVAHIPPSEWTVEL